MSADAPPTVLVVDDDEKNRRLLGDLLERRGFVVLRAGSGEEALALAAGCRADLVLLDIRLPGIDGVQTLAALRRMPGWERVPVFAMTASVMPEEKRSFMAHGFAALVAKPLPVMDVLRMIQAELGRRSAAPGGGPAGGAA
jgi:CheY-like chemotaxis protein